MVLFRYINSIYSLIGIAFGIWAFNALHNGVAAVLVLLYIYILPPVLFRVFFRVAFPKYKGDLKALEEVSYVGQSAFTVWWVSSQLQVHYSRFLFLEEFIKLVPGAYSAWLRLWGAKIGKNVTWAPQLLFMDRPFMSIGDNVIVGACSRFTPHLVNVLRDERKAKLYLCYITVGNNVTIGGAVDVAPGSNIPDGTVVKARDITSSPRYNFKH